MRILDEQNNEITTEDVDGRIGYLEVEKLFVRHHPKIEGQEGIYHYKVGTFHFTDGTFLSLLDENDPHVIPINPDKGEFGYQNLEGESYRELQSVDVITVVDQESQPTVEAWDEYEYIQRYKKFTTSELAAKKEREKKEEEIEDFLNSGPQRLKILEEKIKELERRALDD